MSLSELLKKIEGKPVGEKIKVNQTIRKWSFKTPIDLSKPFGLPTGIDKLNSSKTRLGTCTLFEYEADDATFQELKELQPTMILPCRHCHVETTTPVCSGCGLNPILEVEISKPTKLTPEQKKKIKQDLKKEQEALKEASKPPGLVNKPQAIILNFLSECNTPQTRADIAKSTGISNGMMSRHIGAHIAKEDAGTRTSKKNDKKYSYNNYPGLATVGAVSLGEPETAGRSNTAYIINVKGIELLKQYIEYHKLTTPELLWEGPNVEDQSLVDKLKNMCLVIKDGDTLMKSNRSEHLSVKKRKPHSEEVKNKISASKKSGI